MQLCLQHYYASCITTILYLSYVKLTSLLQVLEKGKCPLAVDKYLLVTELECYYCVHKGPTLACVLWLMKSNPHYHIPLFTVNFNIILPSVSRIHKWSFPSDYQSRLLCVFLFSTMATICSILSTIIYLNKVIYITCVTLNKLLYAELQSFQINHVLLIYFILFCHCCVEM